MGQLDPEWSWPSAALSESSRVINQKVPCILVVQGTSNRLQNDMANV